LKISARAGQKGRGLGGIFARPRFFAAEFLTRSQLCCTSGRASETGAPPKSIL